MNFFHIAYEQFVFAFAAQNIFSTLLTIGLLVFLEISLSGDNALVLAKMASHLPQNDPKRGDERKKALYYGMFGAFVMRGACLLGAGILLNHLSIIKVAGGIYLLTLMCKNLGGESEGDQPEAKHLGFWPTVARIEILDMSFSIDNIAACVALTPNIGLVLLGVFLGIIAMRLVSQLFLNLLEKFPALGKVAYLLIGSVALQMLLSVVFGFELSNVVQFLLVAGFIAAGIAYDRYLGESIKEKLSGPFNAFTTATTAFADFADNYIWKYVGLALHYAFWPITVSVKFLFRQFEKTQVGAAFIAKFQDSPATS